MLDKALEAIRVLFDCSKNKHKHFEHHHQVANDGIVTCVVHALDMFPNIIPLPSNARLGNAMHHRIPEIDTWNASCGQTGDEDSRTDQVGALCGNSSEVT